jgi:hypothetical protein
VEPAKAIVQTGQHPALWQRASGIVIHKPGMDDYIKLKAYCSILLLSCIGKVVQKVVAELLAEGAERRGLISNGLYRSRKWQSAIDVATITVDRVHQPRERAT